MKEIVRIMNEIQAIHPDLEAHLHCLSFAIQDELNKAKNKPTQMDLVVACEKKTIFTKGGNIK